MSVYGTPAVKIVLNTTDPSGSFILNQYAGPQTGNFWVTGKGRVDSKLGIGGVDPTYALHVNTTDPIAASFSGRVIGADAVNPNEFITKAQLDAGVAAGATLLATQVGYGSATNTLTGSGAITFNASLGKLTLNTATGRLIQLGNAAPVAGPNPVQIHMGGSYSDTVAANLKLVLYDNNSGGIVGFGMSSGGLEYVVPTLVTHKFYSGTTALMSVSGTQIGVLNSLQIVWEDVLAPKLSFYGSPGSITGYNMGVASGGILYTNVPTGGKHALRINGVEAFSISGAGAAITTVSQDDTKTAVMVWDAGDKLVRWRSASSIVNGLTAITANNGLTATTISNVQLGAASIGADHPLLHNTFINTDVYRFEVNSNFVDILAGGLTAVNSGGGTALLVSAYGGANAHANAHAVRIDNLFTSTNTVESILQILRSTSASGGANGVGGSIDFRAAFGVTGGNNPSTTTTRLISKWTTAGSVSQFIITGVGPGGMADLFTLNGNGSTQLNKYGLGNMPGTAAYYMAVDATGKLIEVGLPSGTAPPHTLLGTIHTDTVAGAPVLGALIVGNGTPAWDRLLGQTTANKRFLTQTGTGVNSAIPQWSSIVTADIPSAALTKVDDTNVTLTLTGSPSTALLTATGITVGWAGLLAPGRGGTGLGTYVLGDILYASAANVLSALAGNTVAARRFLRQTGTGAASAAPVWDTITTADITGLDTTYVPLTRTLTINGSAQDLSTNRTWTITTTGTVNRITVTGGAGLTPTIDIAATYAGQASIVTVGTITAGTWNGSVIGPTFGGTGIATYTTGDILYASATNVLSKLSGNITTGKLFLSQTGTGVVSAAPVWSAMAGSDITGAALTKTDDTNVTLTLGGSPATALLRAASITVGWIGTLPVTRGGTGLAAIAQGDIIYGSAPNTFSTLNKDATATRYLSNTGASNNPAWSQVDLSNGVTGTLPSANLGNGLARSVFGVTGNAAAARADIQGTTDQVLRVATDGLSLSFGTVATGGITNSAVTYAKIQNVSATSRFLGRISAGAGIVEELTGTQATSLLDLFSTTTAVKGVVPGSAGVGSTFFLRADGVWAVPPGSGGGGYTTLTQFVDETPWRIFYSNAAGDVTPLAFGTSGQVLQSTGASTAPIWATPTSGSIGGTIAATQVGYGSGVNTLTSSANFTFIVGTGKLTLNTNTGTIVQLGDFTATASTAPVVMNMGGSHSSVAGANLKLLIYDNNAGSQVGFGVSSLSAEYVAPAGFAHKFYAGHSGGWSGWIDATQIALNTSMALTFVDSIGEKIRFYGVAASVENYSMGIASSTLYYNAPTSAKHQFRAGGTELYSVGSAGTTTMTTVNALGNIGHLINLITGQTADAFQIRNSGGTPIASINSVGLGYFSGVKIETVAQDDAQTKVAVWDSATKLIKWRAASTFSSGTIGGTIDATQVAYGSALNTIIGTPNFTFNAGSLAISGSTGAGLVVTADGFSDQARWTIINRTAAPYSSLPTAGYYVQLKYNAAGDYAGMGGFVVAKENAVDGEFGSRMFIYSRPHGGSIVAGIEMNAQQRVFLGSYVGINSNPYRFQVGTTSTTDGGILIGLQSSHIEDAIRINNGGGTPIVRVMANGTALVQKLGVGSYANGAVDISPSAQGWMYIQNNINGAPLVFREGAAMGWNHDAGGQNFVIAHHNSGGDNRTLYISDWDNAGVLYHRMSFNRDLTSGTATLENGTRLTFGSLVGDPAAATGMVYYNSTGNGLKLYDNEKWKYLLTTYNGASGLEAAIDLTTTPGMRITWNPYTFKYNWTIGTPYSWTGITNQDYANLGSDLMFPLNGRTLSFMAGAASASESYGMTHFINHGMTFGNGTFIPDVPLIRVGSFNGVTKGTWYNPMPSGIMPTELMHMYTYALGGTMGTSFALLRVENDTGTADAGNNYVREQVGIDVMTRINTADGSQTPHDWIGLKVASQSVGGGGLAGRLLLSRMFAIKAWAGRIYSEDGFHAGSKTADEVELALPGYFTYRSDLGRFRAYAGGAWKNIAFETGNTAWRMYYTNAAGTMTELAFDVAGKVLQSNGATSAPSWVTPTGGGGGGYTTISQFVDEAPWGLYYANGSGDMTAFALGTTNQVLTSTGISSAPIWVTPTSSIPTKFGKTGEDAAAAEIRAFNTSGFAFSINNGANTYLTLTGDNVGINRPTPTKRLDVKGNVGILSAGLTGYYAGSRTAALEIATTAAADAFINTRFTTAGAGVSTAGVNLDFFKTDGATPTTLVAAIAGTRHTNLTWQAVAADNTTIWSMAQMRVIVGSVASTTVGGFFAWYTGGDTGDGGEKMLLDETGALRLSAGGGQSWALPSSLLELASVTKGFLPPRMSTTQKNAIAAPATGLMVYDNTLNKPSWYTGTVWQVPTGRFGVAGEDAAAAEERAYTMTNNSFEFKLGPSGGAGGLLMGKSSVNNYAEISATIYNTGSSVTAQVAVNRESTTGNLQVNMGLTGAGGLNAQMVFTSGQALLDIGASSVFKINSLDEAVGTKTLRYDPGTGLVSYHDIPSGGGAGGGFTTADNGLTASSATNVQLFGPAGTPATLLNNRSLTAGAFTLAITGTANNILTITNTDASNVTALNVSANGGGAVVANSTTNVAISGTSNSGSGGSFRSSTSNAIDALTQSTTIATITAVNGAAGAGTVKPALALSRAVTGATATNNTGISIDFYVESDDDQGYLTNQIVSLWTTVALATRRSAMIFRGVNAGLPADLVTIAGTGAIRFHKYGINTFGAAIAYALGVDASGNIVEYTPSAGGGGTIGGAIAAGQVAYGSAANTITGSADITFASGLLTLNKATGKNLQLGDLTSAAVATPVQLNLGGSFSSAAGTNPKLVLYDNGTLQYGIGVHASVMFYSVPAAVSHRFYVSTGIAMILGTAGIGTYIQAPNNTEVGLQVFVDPVNTANAFEVKNGLVIVSSISASGQLYSREIRGRIVPRIGTTTTTTSFTFDADLNDMQTITALSSAITMNNPIGTLADGQKIMIRIKSDAAVRTLTWSGTQWRAGEMALPIATIASKTMYLGFIWNAADTKWDFIAYSDNY